MTVTTRNHAHYVGEWDLDRIGAFDFYTCGNCGVTWAMPEAFTDMRKEDHKTWYCPNGHNWHFSGENREEKLRRERDEAQARAAREADRRAAAVAERDQAQASLRATKGVVTRQRKKLARVKNGVCPCCNRHFANVEAHMKTKHPDWQPTPEAAA